MLGREFEPRQRGQASKFVDKQLLDSLSTPSERGFAMRGTLWGLLELGEYRNRSIKRVDKLYKQEGGKNSEQFLENNPIIACPIPVDNEKTDPSVLTTNMPLRTAIIAGHHRVRRAPGHIVGFPTEFITPAQGAEMYEMEVKEFVDTVEGWMDDTVVSFREANPKPHFSVIEEKSGLYIATPLSRGGSK